MDIRKIKKLIELIEGSDVTEVEVHEGEESVRISRARPPVPVAAPPAVPAPRTPVTVPPAPEEGHTVRSPLVGIFYAAPSPEQPPYVELGQSVSPGAVLCIVEAMKVMNHIEAPVAGTILKVLVENGEPVEYDQALFVIQDGVQQARNR